MGWRGAVRSFGAVMRAAERDALRNQKLALKEAITADSASAVDAWHEYLRRLVSVHVNRAKPIDWEAIAATPAPKAPTLRDEHEREARKKLESFQPRWTDVFQGGSKKIRRQLELAVGAAPDADLSIFQAAKTYYKTALDDWKSDHLLAEQLLKGDFSNIGSIFEEMKTTLQGDGYVGGRTDYYVEGGIIHATPLVHDIDIVPKFRRKQLVSGRLSETKMPVSELNELYQDYVASVALKVSGDLFQILPIEECYVTCETEMVNQQTGHKENTSILSVHFVRTTFDAMHLGGLDPSDAMRNFRHAMSFKRNQGFSKISRLTPAN